jgi:hypothetical protein
MAFHVGQKVVCVDIRPRRKYLHPATAAASVAPLARPEKGGIYTMREVFDARPHGFDHDALLLAEILNPVLDYIAPAGPVRCEQFFLAFRFRPLRTTSIDVFTRMLEPVPKESAQLVDA